VDTFAEPSEDIQPWRDAPSVREASDLVQPRSVVVLMDANPESAEGRWGGNGVGE